ncbi:hypothetical protein [Streptomyces cahuitamycinicus]|uniref:Uncharacterized protein n=1 Tax=Streptomyces cahuitamycinicus TaxID=2070367 RepID=A0A2N8TTL6_9ACTN|nr:hypothetical protein [Streptomyces cahuitamycinicus]PNG22340.1 hypothetical protein C1J00_10010 [Streptomyces cahuitamycinicus]
MAGRTEAAPVLEPPLILTPSDDPRPVERAVVDGIAGDFGPETFLWIVFNRPDGGARVWYAWTSGGHPLGDDIDRRALAAPLDAADWLHLMGKHLERRTRGRVQIDAHPLRPILADLQAGVRAPDDERVKLRRMVELAADMTGQARPADRPVRWVGVGPDLLITRKAQP